MTSPTDLNTYSVDCGGGGIKVAVVAFDGRLLTPNVRLPTPYPIVPDDFVEAIASLRDTLETDSQRASIGIPGMIRSGIVRYTPHYVTESGPFSAPRDDLVAAWQDFDAQSALQARLGVPTLVVNDAELAGAGVIAGTGLEVTITLGTGMGFALFNDGSLLPKIELSQAIAQTDTTYDRWLGALERTRIGNDAWSARVVSTIATLRRVFFWDRLYLGGGNAQNLDRVTVDALGADVTIVENVMALLGGPRLWDRR